MGTPAKTQEAAQRGYCFIGPELRPLDASGLDSRRSHIAEPEFHHRGISQPSVSTSISGGR